MPLRSLATITTPAERVALTTLDRLKAELGIETDADDALLAAKILEASSDIEAHLGRTLARAGITERFWWSDGGCGDVERFVLDRYPVASMTSVTLDGTAVSSGEYLLDGEVGLLYRLTASGAPSSWSWGTNVIAVYAGGYELPGADNPTLPPVIEAACLELLTSYWTARGRDPQIRSEDIPGLGSASYWVGAVGESGELPPSVVSKLIPFRRPML